MAFDLSDYNTVPERMAEAFAKYPEGRFQSDIVELPAAFAGQFVAVKARYYRTPDDPTPGEGLAWELVPGKTPYTKDSELMNAETSAWGRALIAAFAADAKKGVASREEVESRRPEPAPRPRSGGRRGPSSGQTVTLPGELEAPQRPENGAQGHLTPEQAIQVATIKKDLLARLEGDIGKSAELWEGTIRNFGLDPKQPLPADMIPAVEHAIKALLI